MVVQFCEDCGNLLDESRKDFVTCELCGKLALNTMLYNPQVSVSKGFPSRLRDKLKSNTQEVARDAEYTGATIQISCPKCPSKEVTWIEAQLRNADEGSTIFDRCTKCRHRWIEHN